MIDIKEVYPDAADYHFFGVSDYQPMIDSFGYEMPIIVHDDDYQGDSRYLFQDGTRYGVLIFGWGSCSGCDALQACDGYEEVDELRNDLFNSIIWFDSKNDCLDYFNNHDWEGDYGWHNKETREFINAAREFLKG